MTAIYFNYMDISVKLSIRKNDLFHRLVINVLEGVFALMEHPISPRLLGELYDWYMKRPYK